MRSCVKKQLEEMMEYIDFPVVVYCYETGKVITSNSLAKKVLEGGACQNVNLLWPDQKKLKLSKEVLAGASQLFFEQKILVGTEIRMVDFEVNVLSLEGQHIVVVFFEQSYKQAFGMDQAKLLPGLIWMNAKGEYITANAVMKPGLDRYLYFCSHREEVTAVEENMIQNIETQKNMILDKGEPVFGQMEQVDFNLENSGFVTMNKLPIFGKEKELLGILLISKPIVSDKDYQQMYANVRFENAMIRECVIGEKKIVMGVDYEQGMLVRYATANFREFGYSMEEIAMRKIRWMDLIDPEDQKRVKEEMEDAFDRKDRFFRQKYRVKNRQGQSVWVDTICTGKEFQSATDMMHVVIAIDGQQSSDTACTRVVMKHDTYLDFLTGLPNRLKYEIDSKNLIEAAIAGKKRGFVIVLDLDDFRHINEGLGPEYGDILLKTISRQLNDIPEVENYCYRVDGDEFLLFVRGEYSKQIEKIIQQCLQLFQVSWQLEDKECYCSVSVGIAEYPKNSSNPRELLKQADAAVYEAKRKGKNRIQHYKKAVLKTSQDRVNYEKYLRKAIAKGCVEFEMFFQPIVMTQTKKLVCSEALVRWYSPELGFITPINFISLSEYLGLIVPLGEYVLHETFRTCKYWNDTYDPDFMVSVNLSVIQLVQPNIVERIKEIARTTDVNPKNIVLEVTESLAVEDMNLMKNVLIRLKEYGFSIALDDFGTGYSSLNHIMEMPLDYIKIDKSFVSNYGTANFNPSLLSAITELAHSVNMEVIVEGVETKQQMEFLMFLNTDRIQGYLYGKPMPAKDFEKDFFQREK